MSSAVMLSVLLVSTIAWGYEKEIEALSMTMAEDIAIQGKEKIAVVDFTNLEGVVSYFGKFIAEQFTIALSDAANKSFRVIDRNSLNSIIKEHKLSQTGLIDQETARQLGKIAGVDALVTGTLIPFGDNVQLIVKVLDADTADVIDAAKISIARTEAVNELLQKKIELAASTEPVEAKNVQKKNKEGNSNAFFDDFNAGPKPDWKPISGNWTMSNGQYTVTDINAGEVYITSIEGRTWNNFILSIDVIPGETGQGCCYYRAVANICPRLISSEEKICFGLSGAEKRFIEAYWFISKNGTQGEHVSTEKIETPKGQPVNIKIEAKNGVFSAYMNNSKINDIYDKTFLSGAIGLGQSYGSWGGDTKSRVAFDNLEIKPGEE